MTLTQVWGVLVIFVVCPILGGLPLIQWITQVLTGRSLTQQGTGNVSVSAAFYHGGRGVGVLAVLSEAFKGIAAVLLARLFFPVGSAWEVGALIALVMGRYWFAKGAGTTNVTWGFVVHDPIVSGLVFLVSGISFTILRDRKSGKYGVLVWLTLFTALLHPDNGALILMTAALSFLMGWIYTKVPDDLTLNPHSASGGSRAMFQFFRGDRALRSLNDVLAAAKYGQKAATLATLKRLGYPVPMGWVILPGDDLAPLGQNVDPSPHAPVVVRSSAVGEDSETASAAGQYTSVVNVSSREALLPAITRCFQSYDRPSAVQYRRDRHLPDAAMAVIVQEQVRGVFSGVAFSRDPIARQGNQVIIEALPGAASQVVSGRITPETYRVVVEDDLLQPAMRSANWQLPSDLTLPVEGTGHVPPHLIQQVAYLARHLESHYHSIPQDIEWSFDGDQLWLLQSRPVTTLLPIWTRKIAAEVIPGLIRPLTWSINRPLTCGVWGDIFTIVLGQRANGLDFTATATLHYSRSYFNASLLGEIFRRMGLPPESLEFLIRGAKFSKPPLLSTLQNVPGLLRLLHREWRVEQDFRRDERTLFVPAITTLSQAHPHTLTDAELLSRINFILSRLKVGTYYSILAPLSAALRKAIAKVPDEAIANSATPEVAALRSLQDLARSTHHWLETASPRPTSAADLLTWLQNNPAGQPVWQQLEQIIEQYGYLSEVGTDIAVPTWQEDPEPIRTLFAQLCLNPPPGEPATTPSKAKPGLQRRFDLKGRVTEIYSRLLAELRWSFVALEQRWLTAGWLAKTGDIFYLTFDEVRQRVENPSQESFAPLIAQRQAQLERDRKLATVPFIVYGNDPPEPALHPTWTASQRLQGIGASAGSVEGRVKVILSLQDLPPIGRETIIVVPYTDSGWAPLLAQAGGLIAEAGGRLSHGAIVAREYRIPAVMDIPNATQRLHDGQLIRMDGQQGIVEIL
jgi:pyruvate,water dikinase